MTYSDSRLKRRISFKASSYSFIYSFFIVLYTVQAQSKAPPNNQIMPFQRPICTVILSCRVQTGPTLNKHSKQILLSAQHRGEPLHRIQTAIKGRCASRYCTVLFPKAASILRSCLHLQRQAELQSCLALGSLTTGEKVILSQDISRNSCLLHVNQCPGHELPNQQPTLALGRSTLMQHVLPILS